MKVDELTLLEMNIAPANPCAERSLLVAIVARALLDAHSPAEWMEKEKESALEWLYSEKEHAWSMKWVCERLDICPRAIQRALEQNEINTTVTGLASAQGRVVKQRKRLPRSMNISTLQALKRRRVDYQTIARRFRNAA